MVCSKCQSHRMRRIRREGILRAYLAPLFGYFPWRCSVCRTEKLFRNRGQRRSATDLIAQRDEFSGRQQAQQRKGIAS